MKHAKQRMFPKAYTLDEVAEITRAASTEAVYDWIKRPEGDPKKPPLKAHKTGKRWLVWEADLLRFTGLTKQDLEPAA